MLRKIFLITWKRTRQEFHSIFFPVTLIFIFSLSNLLAQSNGIKSDAVRYTIGFGETLQLSFQDSTHFKHISWSISEVQKTGVLHQGLGADLNEYMFSEPGQYVIFLKEADVQENENSQTCNHSNIPSEILVTVHPYRLAFYFDEISFSTDLRGGVDTKGVRLNVPVKIESYMNQEVDISKFKVKSAGVGTTIQGEVVNEFITVLPGTYSVSFELKGSCQKNTYIMFDFFNDDEMLSTYYLPQILN